MKGDSTPSRRAQDVLGPVVEGHGFEFVPVRCDAGSGGHFEEVSFVGPGRELRLWWRGDVLRALYVVGGAELDHVLYARLLGAGGTSRFPCSGDLAMQLDALAADLMGFGAGFLYGPAHEFRKLVEQHDRDPERFRGLRGL